MTRAAALASVLLGAACVRRAEPAPSPPVCRHAAPVGCAGAAVDLARDVRPVLARRCLSCHAGDGMAAEDHDLSRVESVRAARKEIASEVAACAMPPREPLPDPEADVLSRWASCAGPAP